MGKKLKRYTEEDLARAFRTNSAAVGAKGSYTNPYTVAEMDAMREAGTWEGGFVEGLGYVAKDHIVEAGSSSSGSSSENWYCPTCGHPYPPDAGSGYIKCSNCGSSVEPPSGPRPGSGGGGGGGTGGEGQSPALAPVADLLTKDQFHGFLKSDPKGCQRRCVEMLREVGVEMDGSRIDMFNSDGTPRPDMLPKGIEAINE